MNSNKLFKFILLLSGCFVFLNFNLLEQYNINMTKISKIFKDNQGDYLIYIKKQDFKLFVINSSLADILDYLF